MPAARSSFQAVTRWWPSRISPVSASTTGGTSTPCSAMSAFRDAYSPSVSGGRTCQTAIVPMSADVMGPSSVVSAERGPTPERHDSGAPAGDGGKPPAGGPQSSTGLWEGLDDRSREERIADSPPDLPPRSGRQRRRRAAVIRGRRSRHPLPRGRAGRDARVPQLPPTPSLGWSAGPPGGGRAVGGRSRRGRQPL